MSYKRSRTAFETDHAGPPQHAPFALYGTPLPAFDPGSRDDGSYVPIWKQEVTDERGRKRLHGAFTGGWSAGYFNTVGSKEGWTPSNFVSSRSNRANEQKDGKRREQKAEDFMDEEDLAAQAESQHLETQGAFAGLGSTSESSASNGMFAELFRTTGETMGTKLLQRMGWRQGQGIGAKIRRRVKGDKSGEMHLFAPENSRMITFNRKTDRRGLGFAGEERLAGEMQSTGHDDPEAGDDGSEQDARILQSNRSKVLSKPKKIKKSGFGTGVLNDTGSDDENEYDMGPRISYNRIIGGNKKKKKSKDPASGLADNATKATARPSSLLDGFRKCHDGRLPLDGFMLTLAPLSLSEENKHPPPTVPDNWKSSMSTETIDNKSATYQSAADVAKTSTLDPTARAKALGEQPLPGKSIFDFMSSATRSRLATASGKTNLPPARNERPPPTPNSTTTSTTTTTDPETLRSLIPPLDPQTALTALHRSATGWAPYANDPDPSKRTRYEAFLRFHADKSSDLPIPARPANLSLEDWTKELNEFAQAAEVFRPISRLMAARFTTSSSSSSSITPAVATDAREPEVAAGRKQEKEEDPAVKAARMGLYGPLTRSREAFWPSRLLCKRFGVRAPLGVDPGSAAAAAAADNGAGAGGVSGDGSGSGSGRKLLDVVSQASLDRMMMVGGFQAAGPSSGGGGIDGGGGPVNFVSGGREGGNEGVKVGESRASTSYVNGETNLTLEGSRADENVLRAVFGDEEDAEDEDR